MNYLLVMVEEIISELVWLELGSSCTCTFGYCASADETFSPSRAPEGVGQ